MTKRNISEEVLAFFQLWKVKDMSNFFEDVLPVLNLFQDEELGFDPNSEENTKNVRIVRYVYLISYLAETYAGKFARIKSEHKDLWKRLEKLAEEALPEKPDN